MDTPFFIDVWSDVVCPFCYLGTRQLQAALSEFEHAEHVVIRHRAFELDPRSHSNYDLSLAELLSKKYGMSIEEAIANNLRLSNEAAKLGMKWALDKARPGNTFSAHRLMALSASQGLAHEMSERLFEAYFCNGEVISDQATLTNIAQSVGVQGAESLWNNSMFEEEVRADEEMALELGITGVPSLVLDNKFMVVGAQGSEQILNVLRRAWARREVA